MVSVIYTFAKSTLAIPWCVGAVALAAGFVLVRQRIRLPLKIVPFVIAVMALGLFAPAMQNDKIEVTLDSFYLRTGLWWSPNEHRFEFRDAVRLEIITIPDVKGRPDRYMRVTLKGGVTDDVP